jgi:hypothetical protein
MSNNQIDTFGMVIFILLMGAAALITVWNVGRRHNRKVKRPLEKTSRPREVGCLFGSHWDV